MKRCPDAGEIITMTLIFCLDDGADCVDRTVNLDEPATAIFQETTPSSGSALNENTPKSRFTLSVSTAVLIAVVSILLVAAVAFAVYEFKLKKDAPVPRQKRSQGLQPQERSGPRHSHLTVNMWSTPRSMKLQNNRAFGSGILQLRAIEDRSVSRPRYQLWSKHLFT